MLRRVRPSRHRVPVLRLNPTIRHASELFTPLPDQLSKPLPLDRQRHPTQTHDIELQLAHCNPRTSSVLRRWPDSAGHHVRVNGYELLAAGFLALAALATLIRGRHFTTALQFILASAAGCTAVFATARSTIDFSDPWLTYTGVVLGALAATAVGLAFHRSGV